MSNTAKNQNPQGDVNKVATLESEVVRLRAALEEARQRVQALTELADQDPLIEIMNRRAFVREISRTMANSERHGMAASVVYVDVNNLRDVNDNYGHSAGDAVLRYIGDILSTQIRKTDSVGRLGGDEFGLLLSHSKADNAELKMEAIASMIANKPLVWRNCALNISIAYGVFPIDPMQDIDLTLEAADAVMYQRKNGTKIWQS